MQLSDIITPERTVTGVDANSKKRVLEKLAELIAGADPALVASEVFDSMLARERLGSTGLGRGVAIPHGRIQRGDHTIGVYMQTVNGVDFDAPDHEPVDLLFGLLVPEASTEEHLEILGKLAEMFSDEAFRSRLRGCVDAADAFDLLTGWKHREP